uniref:Uncharacterized protein n=1 Tax=Eptatretus burgeri TaxID=7764 RepID=A0A8C4WZM6_EPTBU
MCSTNSMDAAPPQRTPSKTGSHGPSRRPSDHGSGSPGIRSIRRSGSSAANGPSYGSLSRLPSNSGPADRPSSASGQNATEPLTPPPSYVVDASSAAVVSSPHPGSQCGSRSTPGTVRRGQRRKATDNQESPAADSISVTSLRSSVHAPIRPSRWKQPSSGGSLPPNLGAPASPYTSRSSQGQPVSPHIPRPKQGPPSSPHIHRPTQDPPASPHILRSSQASTASPHLQRPAQGPPVSPRAPGLNQTSVLLSRPPLPKTHPPSHFSRNAPDNQDAEICDEQPWELNPHQGGQHNKALPTSPPIHSLFSLFLCTIYEIIYFSGYS